MTHMSHDEMRESIAAFLADSPADDSQRFAGAWVSRLTPYISLEAIHDPDPPASPYHRLTFAFTVQKDHVNGLGSLHGGATATLFDLLTTLPLTLQARPGYWQLWGVTRHLNITYLRPPKPGSRLLVDCEVVQIGKRICSLRGVMRSDDQRGAVLAFCEHSKMNVDPPADEAKL